MPLQKQSGGNVAIDLGVNDCIDHGFILVSCRASSRAAVYHMMAAVCRQSALQPVQMHVRLE